MKKNIFIFLFGFVAASFVSYVIAETYISADKISFENDKTIKTNVDDALDELYENVDALDKSDATAENILSGKKVAIGRKLVTGTMPNKGAWTSTPTLTGDSKNVPIPAGYHDGNGYIDTTNIWQAGYDAGYRAGGSDRSNIIIPAGSISVYYGYASTATATVNIAQYTDKYRELTVDNFLFELRPTAAPEYSGGTWTPSYNPNTGDLSVTTRTSSYGLRATLYIWIWMN